jgi:phospholipid/cholesterol/gamma-HCH transport system substrate-binding protein
VRAAREAAEEARSTIASLRGSADGRVQNILADLGQTVTSTREAMANLAEDTEALKRSFFFRGFFEDRGYYNLDRLTGAEYLAGALAGDHRSPIRVWLRADLLFAEEELDQSSPARPDERPEGGLTEEGRIRLDRAMAEVLRYPADTPLVVESYATGATRDARYRRARHRATEVLAYLRSRFALSPHRLTTMALDSAPNGQSGQPRDAVGLALWVDRRVLATAASR